MSVCHIFVSVHEKTLIEALQMLSLWCNKFISEVPRHVMDWLKVQCQKFLYSRLDCCRIAQTTNIDTCSFIGS
jgi:hypothetical protein